MQEAILRNFVTTDYPKLVSALTLTCGSRAAAEDAVQEAMARAWVRLERGESIESLPAWIRTVALNESRSQFRRTRAEVRARIRRGAPAEATQMPDQALATDVHRALAGLPRRQREVAVLRYLLDLPLEQIAETLSIAEGTVKSQLSKAKANLAASLHLHEEVNHAIP